MTGRPLTVFALLALLLGSTRAGLTDDNPNAGPVEISVQGGALTTLTAEAGAGVTPLAWVEVDGPIVLGSWTPVRGYTRLGIASSPGETVDLASVETFRAAEVVLGVYRVVGRRTIGSQDVVTGLALEAGFTTRLPGEAEPRERTARRYAAGVVLQERTSGMSLSLLYGRDEVAGDRGWGQILIRGQVPLAGTRGTLVLTGDAALALGPRSPDVRQRDVVRLGLAVDLGATVRAVRGSVRGSP